MTQKVQDIDDLKGQKVQDIDDPVLDIPSVSLIQSVKNPLRRYQDGTEYSQSGY